MAWRPGRRARRARLAARRSARTAGSPHSRDQQDEGRRSEQERQHGPQLAHEPLLKRQNGGPPSGIGFRIGVLGTLGDGSHLVGRLLDRDAGAEAGDDLKPRRARTSCRGSMAMGDQMSTFRPRSSNAGGMTPAGRVHRSIGPCSPERRDRRRIAAATARGSATRPGLFPGLPPPAEGAGTQGWVNTEDTEEIGGYGSGRNFFRLAALRQDNLRGSDRRDIREIPGLPAPLEEIAHRGAALLHGLSIVGGDDRDQPASRARAKKRQR